MDHICPKPLFLLCVASMVRDKNASAKPSYGVYCIITRVIRYFMVRSTVPLYATVICSRSEAPVSGIAIIRRVIQATDNERSFSHG